MTAILSITFGVLIVLKALGMSALSWWGTFMPFLLWILLEMFSIGSRTKETYDEIAKERKDV